MDNVFGRLSSALSAYDKTEVERLILFDYAKEAVEPRWPALQRKTLDELGRMLHPAISRDVAEPVSFIYGLRDDTSSAVAFTEKEPPDPHAWVSRCLDGHPEAALWIEKILSLRLTFAALHPDRLVASKRVTPATVEAMLEARRRFPNPPLQEPERPSPAHDPVRRELALQAVSHTAGSSDPPSLSRQILRGLLTGPEGGPKPARLSAAYDCLREEAAAVAYVLLHLLFPAPARGPGRASSPRKSAALPPSPDGGGHFAIPPALDRYLLDTTRLLRSDPWLLLASTVKATDASHTGTEAHSPPSQFADRCRAIAKAHGKETNTLIRSLFQRPLDARAGKRPRNWGSAAALAHPLLAAYLGDPGLVREASAEGVRASAHAAQAIAGEVAAEVESSLSFR